MIALIAFVVTMLPLSAFAEARTSFIRSRIDSRPARPDSGIEIVPHKTENPKRSAIWDGSIAAGFAGGSGTEDDPYLISNGSELAYLAQQVNSGNSYENVHFKLTNDIYLNDTTDWELWGTTGSSSAGKVDTCDEEIEPTKQDKGDKMDAPIAIPVRPAPKTELESDALSDALNAAGQSNTFVSTGSYPWMVDSTTYDGRTAAQSGNHNVSNSTSSFSTTVTLSAGDIVSFEYCVSSESNYDKFKFSVNDSVVLTKSGLVSWNSYSYQATADGEYTFLWSYTKDGSVNGNSDACWVDNVYIGAPLAVTGIDVLEHLDIPVNGTGTVAYSVLPENAYNKNVSFESADAGIAAVNANGVVTGVSAGETTITVTTEDGGFTGACTINVYNQAVTGVTIEPSEAELNVGSSTKLTATVLPENASNKNVVYSVDDESILSVDQDGNVTGLSLGTATVTVTTEDGGFSASAEITVIPVQVTGVSISPKSASVDLGRTIQLTASIKPSNATNKNLSWSVSDETIISVDDRGTVTGLSLGTATATVTTEDGGFTASAEITVCYAPANTWTAIGEEFSNFYGCFDGNGYAVRGIYINTQESYQGLFGYSGVVSIIANLGVAESYIYGDTCVGGVVGRNGAGYNGVEYSSGTVTNCYNTGSVTGSNGVGGVAGHNSSSITDCYNTGSVTGKDYVGGVAGSNSGFGTVTNCYNTGSVTGKNKVGGVAGYNDYIVTGCYNEGSVTGEEYVGGVVGENDVTVTGCYNTGSVTGERVVGGVVGYSRSAYDRSTTVANCYNTGIVNGNERVVGGVVGYNEGGTVTDCYNEGSITGGNGVGGVVSENSGTVINCYYNVGCCANSNSYGIALTNEQMLRAESFEGFDFETVWTMDGNPGYPYPKLINNFQNCHGVEQLPEIDITKKSIYVAETGTLYPVKNAKVTVRTAEGYEIEAISNFLGLVEVSVPDSSSYTIAISCEGYCPKSLENVILKNGEFYEAALSKIDYSAPLGGSVEVTYTDANTTAPLDILAATKRLNSEEANFEFTITAKSFSDLTDGQYELLQDGDVIKTSTDGVFKLKVSDLKPDIPLWIRIRDDGKYCKPAKLGLSTYTGVFGLHDGDEVKLMDKLELPIPSDIPFLGGSVISLDLGYIPVKVKSKGDTVRIGLGTDNLFDPEDKDMWEKLKESVRKGAAAYGATAFGTVDLGGKVKPDLKIIGFAEGKITAHGLEVVSGEMIIQAKIKYEHEWQTFAWVIPIVIKVGVGLELENTLEIDWENGLKVNDRVELTIPNLKPKAGIGIAYVADVSVYGKAENVLGFDTKTNYYFGELKGEAGLSAKVLLWEGKWCLISGQWRYAEGYLKSGHSFDEMSYSLISRDYLKEQSGWLGDKPAKDAVGAKQTSVLQENVLSIASPMLANVNGKLIAVWIADDGSRTTGNHSQIVYSLYNEADNTWSAPTAVWDDGTADFTPQMVSDGTNAYVVWADANTVFDENVTTEQMAAACEISYAKLSVDENGNGTVSQQRRLTENSSLDFQPSVAVDANGVHIAWIRNAANDLLAQSGTNAIMYCTETGSEIELHSLATPISSLAIGCMNGNVCIAYCSDEDGDAATVDDVKTYFGTVGGSFAAITEGASNSSTVSFMRFGSEGNKLFFMNNSILCSYDGNAIKQYDSVTEPGNDYSIINDGSNTTYLLYNANNGDNSQLYLRIYDPSNDTWKQPIALTNTPGYAENFSAAVLGTKVVAMFTRSDVTMAADSMETSTDLYAVVMTPAHDLCLSDVAYDSDSITLGGTLPITLTVKNNGELDETGVVVTVSANGVETQSFTIDTLLNSGDTQQVSIEYVLPNTAAVTEFTFSVTSSSGEEILLDDNSIAKELFLADLSIDVHKLMSDSVSTVLVPVSNIGFVDTNATLYIRRDTEDGEILAQFDMGVIHAGMMQVMEFYDAYIKSLMEGSSSLCFSVVADNDEYMIANNSNFISVTEIDLSDSQYKFAVTFVNMDGEVLSTQNIAYGDAAVAPEAPAMEGYIFIGWDKEFGYITDTMTVTARYAIARTVTFVDWDGTVLSTQVVADGNSATAPEVPEREGYTFTGWDVEFTSVTENITVTAQYDIKKYSVVFCDWDGSIISEQVVEHGEAAIAPPDPAREGLNFTGWSIDFSIITSDCFIYAVYAPIANSGDASGDGAVNAVDALVAMRYVLGVSTESLTPEQIAAADFNGDGAVNAVDTLLIMRFSLGLIEAVVSDPEQGA